MQNEMQKEHKRQVARRFVKTTQEMIDSNGISNLSIRKIADRAGFHNSTIYLYFENIDQLVLLASLKYFTEYTQMLETYSYKNGTASENFLEIWEAFGKAVFAKPQVFYNFFFGKYSQNLTSIIEEYYEIFPEEKHVYTKKIEDMYFANSIFERSYICLLPLLGTDGVKFNENNIKMVNAIIVSCFKSILEEQCKYPSENPDEPTYMLLDMIKYIIGL